MVRINRTYTLAASAWLVLVVVGAVLVWAVISRVGEGVITQPSSPVGEAAPITSPPQSKRTDRPNSPKPSKPRPSKSATASPGGPSAGPSGPGSPSSTPNSGPPPPAPTSAGAGPGPTPGPGPGPGPSSSPNNPPSSSSPPPPQSFPDRGVRRTWQGSAGVVTVECRGATISLEGAQPNSGWSIEIDRRGPDEVRVDFESNDGDRRTRVQSECVGGTPRFDVDQDD
ncbi:MAG: hypothetical protein ACRDOX_07380 [Nocardioides sp.]